MNCSWIHHIQKSAFDLFPFHFHRSTEYTIHPVVFLYSRNPGIKLIFVLEPQPEGPQPTSRRAFREINLKKAIIIYTTSYIYQSYIKSNNKRGSNYPFYHTYITEEYEYIDRTLTDSF